MRSLRGHDIAELFSGLYGLYADPAATSDTIIQRFRWGVATVSPSQLERAEALRETAKIYAGLGQLVRARALADTVRAESPGDAPVRPSIASATRCVRRWRRSPPAHGTTTPLR